MNDQRQHEMDELDPTLERAIAALRADDLSEHEVAESTLRVKARLQIETGSTEIGSTETGSELRTCQDYQAAMPALVAGTLPAARKLLVEDHARTCIPCRRELRSIRSGRAIDPARTAPASRESSSSWRLGLAAGFLLAAIGGWFAWTSWPVSQNDLIQVRSYDGQVFEVTADGLQTLKPGEWIDGRHEVRTAKGGGAVFELFDGSRVEVDQRSAFEVVRRQRGSLIRVARGSIIVEASDQGLGKLDVSTDELLASVKGTIFAVSHGSKGSRVSVIEGEVEVEQGRQRTSLFPGDQLASRASLTAAPLRREIGWSANVDRYVAMIQELRALRADINQVMDTEPRYSTRLLDLAPADTVLYVGLPNPTATVAELYQLIRDRIAANPALLEWWQEVEASEQLAELDAFVGEIQELGNFLGGETVVAVETMPDQELHLPVVMSEVVDAAGLRASLAERLAELQAEHPQFSVVLLDESTTTVNESATDLFVWVGPDLLVAAPSIAEIHRISRGESAGFAGTPFHDRIAAAYADGAEYLGAVDLAAVFAQASEQQGGDMPSEDLEVLELSGFADVRHLVVERSQSGDRAYTAADLSFAGPRTGMAAWLAAPGPMGALEFFSPDTTFVGAFVTKDPSAVIDELFELAAGQDESFEEGLGQAEAELGIRLREDLIDTLGGESAAGIDGPALPTPSWKVVIEVYDAARLQATIETLVERMNQEQEVAAVTLTSSTKEGQTFYRLDGSVAESSDEALDLPFQSAGLSYAYVDGYLVAAPSQTLIERAIQYRASGSSVLTSEDFRALLPTDGYLDFSAVVFNRLAEAVSAIASNLPMPAGLTEEQRQTVNGLVSGISESVGPSLYCLYGEDDRIRLVSNSPSLLPFAGLESVFGLGALVGQFEGASWQ